MCCWLDVRRKNLHKVLNDILKWPKKTLIVSAHYSVLMQGRYRQVYDAELHLWFIHLTVFNDRNIRFVYQYLCLSVAGTFLVSSVDIVMNADMVDFTSIRGGNYMQATDA